MYVWVKEKTQKYTTGFFVEIIEKVVQIISEVGQTYGGMRLSFLCF